MVCKLSAVLKKKNRACADELDFKLGIKKLYEKLWIHYSWGSKNVCLENPTTVPLPNSFAIPPYGKYNFEI